jgi:hypothetical protein
VTALATIGFGSSRVRIIAMSRNRSSIVIAVAAVVVWLPILNAGCSSELTDYDQAANYTPESIGQELILRFRALNPDAKAATPRAGKKSAEGALISRRKEEKKVVLRAAKSKGSTSLDDVIDDIDHKITLVKGSTRAETTRKVLSIIASDPSLNDAEKKTLTELVSR